MGSLGTALRKLKKRLGITGLVTKIVDLHKIVIIYSARILQGVRNMVDTISDE